ncbi:MAG: DinB family protein [Gemmatimonadetes bacterium]|nr:DinB family protein [Gemmatimonadota bacterium]
MKGRHQLAALEPMVLGPLHDMKPEDWHRAPKGKWSVAQIVSHLAKGVDLSSTVLEQRKETFGMLRRSSPGQSVLRHLTLTLGRIPPMWKSPASSVPDDKPDAEEASAQFRMGVERFTSIIKSWPATRQLEVFVKHPVLGDLNVHEWIRFHFVHARHHSKQIAERLKRAKKAPS